MMINKMNVLYVQGWYKEKRDFNLPFDKQAGE